MSQFNPETFLDSAITEVQVKRPPLAAGRVFQAIIGEVKSRPWVKKDDPSKSGYAVDLPLTIDLTTYPDELKRLGTDRVIMKDSIMLDLNEGGAIDTSPGKNGKLRRYRDSLGMNVPGQPFTFRAMTGRIIGVKVKHREYEGELYEDVDSVVKA